MRILHNARIYTLNTRQPMAEALVIDDHPPHGGRILAVGDFDSLKSLYGNRAALQDMDGMIILPGLCDAHIHIRHLALGLNKVNCATPTRQECLQRVADRVNETPQVKWVLGHGWNQNEWESGFGNKEELDQISPHNPVYLSASSLHACWVNSLALEAAGINRDFPDPPNGEIQRDTEGNPTGILFEAAIQLIADVIPQPSQNEIKNAIYEAQPYLWQIGLTSVHDYDRRSCFVALQELHQEDSLGLRVLKNLPVETLAETVALGLHTGFGDDLLRIGGIKVFADGALGPHTAAMFEPYVDDPDNIGMLFLNAEEIFEIAWQAAASNLSLTIHAIGDRANHEVLNAFEKLRGYEKAEGLPHLRHRIEHLQILHPQDFGRLAELDILASMQPVHAPADINAAENFWGKRSKYAYAWKTLEDNHAKLVFGSDAPVESPNPFLGIHAAVTRRRIDGMPGPDGWYPEQRLSLDSALRGFTTNAAYAAGMEDRLGMLAEGYLADLIVLEKDIFKIEPDEIKNLLPVGTMVGGDWVWKQF